MLQTDQITLYEEIIRLRKRAHEEKKSEKLLKKCRYLERILVTKELNPDQLIKYQYKILSLSRAIDQYEYKVSMNVKYTWVIIIVMYGLLTIASFKFQSTSEDSAAYTKGVQLLSFMIIVVIGAMANYLINEYKNNKHFVNHVLLAFLFPIIFVNIVDFSENEIKGILVLNGVMFLCGFSIQIFLLVLNRVLEMVKQVFNLEGGPSNIEELLNSRLTDMEKKIDGQAKEDVDAKKDGVS
ncbi:hypothetical protein ACIOBL_09825 [Paenibacillus taichungensis]|uniref:hypothetical protein n=1 Tax=Paenibacillus taichungensis TaxID=484184 RepID=UPI00380C00D5